MASGALCGLLGHLGGPEATEAVPPTRLDTTVVKLRDSPGGELVVIDNRAASWADPRTAGLYWSRVLGRIKDHLSIFSKPSMLTLTVDPHGRTTGRGFECPNEALRYIRDEKLIPRFLRLMGFKKAFAVLAFQGNGWPHWHILIDQADGTKGNFKVGWRTWRDRWGVGGFDIGGGKHKQELQGSPEQVLRYIMNYMQQQHRHGEHSGVPDWVLDIVGKAPRAYELYGELRERVASCHPKRCENIGTAERRERPPSEMTVGERVAGYSRGATVLLARGGRWQFLGLLECTGGRLACADKLGEWWGPDLDVAGFESEDGLFSAVRVSVPLDGRQDPGEVYAKLRSAVATGGLGWGQDLGEVPF